MNRVARELDRKLRQLDHVTAQRVEQLVRDALALAGASPEEASAAPWPEEYFARTAGVLAGEQFERPPQGDVPARKDW